MQEPGTDGTPGSRHMVQILIFSFLSINKINFKLYMPFFWLVIGTKKKMKNLAYKDWTCSQYGQFPSVLVAIYHPQSYNLL